MLHDFFSSKNEKLISIRWMLYVCVFLVIANSHSNSIMEFVLNGRYVLSDVDFFVHFDLFSCQSSEHMTFGKNQINIHGSDIVSRNRSGKINLQLITGLIHFPHHVWKRNLNIKHGDGSKCLWYEFCLNTCRQGSLKTWKLIWFPFLLYIFCFPDPLETQQFLSCKCDL